MIDDDFRRRVFALAAEGLTNRAIGRALGSNHTTVAKVLANPAPLKAPAPLPAHMSPPPALAMAPLDTPDAPALQVVRELLAQAREQFARATQAGDSNGAQRYARTAAGLTPVLARLERAEQDASDAIVVSRAECERIEESLTERIKGVCNRPLLCSKCSRELSVSWGTGKTEAELNADKS